MYLITIFSIYLLAVMMGVWFLILHIKWRVHLKVYEKSQILISAFYLLLFVYIDNVIILLAPLVQMLIMLFGHACLLSNVRSKILKNKLFGYLLSQIILTAFIYGYIIHRGGIKI